MAAAFRGELPKTGAGLYVHVPFCLRKCGYCDFNSYALQGQAQARVKAGITKYLAALQQEMALYAVTPMGAKAHYSTIFVGGGTPTVLSGAELAGLVTAACAMGYHITDNTLEVTVEANPGTLDDGKLKSMRSAGVNRLSLGVQSFDDALLYTLGRVHNAAEAVQAFMSARQAGFKNINLDLMCGLPGQSLQHLRDTLEQAIDLGPEHISCYSLIIEDGTHFGNLHAAGRLHLPGEDTEVAMLEMVVDLLTQAGYEQYEISNFARPGFSCKHNEIYWRNEWYLGLGPGAHSHWINERWANERRPIQYQACLATGHLPVVERQQLTTDEQMDETMMMGLRLLAGVSEARFYNRFGCHMVDVYPSQIERLAKLGLVCYDNCTLRLSERGVFLGNQVFAEFIRS